MLFQAKLEAHVEEREALENKNDCYVVCHNHEKVQKLSQAADPRLEHGAAPFPVVDPIALRVKVNGLDYEGKAMKKQAEVEHLQLLPDCHRALKVSNDRRLPHLKG